MSATALGQAVGGVRELRSLPKRVQVGEEREKDEVGWPFADDLVGDRDVAASGVADVGNIHGRILPSWPRRQQSGSS